MQKSVIIEMLVCVLIVIVLSGCGAIRNSEGNDESDRLSEKKDEYFKTIHIISESNAEYNTDEEVISLSASDTYEVDLDGDKKPESISMGSIYSPEYENYVSVVFIKDLNGNEIDRYYNEEGIYFDCYIYVIDLVPNDGKRELLMGSWAEGDYCIEEIHAYDEGKPRKISMEAPMSNYWWRMDECVEGTIKMSVRLDLYGTRFGMEEFTYVDGVLVSKNKMIKLYNSEWNNSMLLKKALNARYAGNDKSGTVKIEEGTEITFYSTDYESYMEFFITSEGVDSQKYRFNIGRVGESEWMHTVNGDSEDVYFDCEYAG